MRKMRTLRKGMSCRSDNNGVSKMKYDVVIVDAGHVDAISGVMKNEI